MKMTRKNYGNNNPQQTEEKCKINNASMFTCLFCRFRSNVESSKWSDAVCSSLFQP